MAANLGTVPADLSSPTGKFRLLANDLISTPLSPPSAGRGSYELFSDAEISAYIDMYPLSMFRAVGVAYMSLAARAATESKIVKDYDLQADLTKRAADLRQVAAGFFDRADAQDEQSAEASTFGLSGGYLTIGYIDTLPEEIVSISVSAPGFGNGGYGQ